MAPFAFRALPVFSARDATLDFEQLTFALNKGDLEINAQGELKIIAGAWTNPEAISAKLEETTTLQVRTEQGKTVARLKGVVKAKEELPVKTVLFTLPAGFRPSTYDHLLASIDAAGVTLLLRIKATGAVELETIVPAARFFSFDGITFNLT